MRQERKRYFSFREKFEDGVLRVDACSDRYSLPRELQYRSYLEDLPSQSFGSSAVRDEMALIRDVHRLMAIGFTPIGSETLEEFVARHCDFLGKEVI